jgi:hypothetical protein
MRQAIVVIHGIGEQRPMETLRGFAEAVLPTLAGKPQFWSKPDPLSELFELRKLTAPQTHDTPPTDLFEYYWAYQAQGTKFMHIVSWARTLLFRSPLRVPSHLRFLWWTIWTLIVAFLYLFAAVPWRQGIWAAMTTANALWLLAVAVVLFTISFFVISYVGDAARYLNARPPNITMRQRIRAEGLKLLESLHESRDYDRIVVVGHSLGSVIAYDLVKNLWPKYNTAHARIPNISQPIIRSVDTIGESLAAASSESRLQDFRTTQLELWKEERRIGNRWLITDLITAGSPLAHAALLLADDLGELRQRQNERELPICPPVPDTGSYSYQLPYNIGSASYTYRALHHGAMFACTRWTNLYFPAPLGIVGDLVGGPIARVFGPGVKDVPVSSAEGGGLLQHTPVIHTHYWHSGTIGTGQPDRPASLEALRTALALDSRAWLSEVVAPSGDKAVAV